MRIFSALGWPVIRIMAGTVLLRGLIMGLGLGILFGGLMSILFWGNAFGLAFGCLCVLACVSAEIPLAIRRCRGAIAMQPVAQAIETFLGEDSVTIVSTLTHTSNLDPDITLVERSAHGTRQMSWTPSDITPGQIPGPHLHLSTLDPTTELVTASYCVLVPKPKSVWSWFGPYRSAQ